VRFEGTCYRAHDPRWSFKPLSGDGGAIRGARFNPKSMPTRLFGGGLGLFLIIYSVLVLFKPNRLRIKLSGWKPAVTVGATGGVVGGFSAFPGSIPVVYLGLRGLSKTETRNITQPYILALQLISLSILALTRFSIFNMQFWLLWALTLPAVLLGTSTGLTLYRRFSEVNFRRAVLILLIVSGVSLLAKSLI
jgi:uncharacterized membrane protein YfcA